MDLEGELIIEEHRAYIQTPENYFPISPRFLEENIPLRDPDDSSSKIHLNAEQYDYIVEILKQANLQEEDADFDEIEDADE